MMIWAFRLAKPRRRAIRSDPRSSYLLACGLLAPIPNAGSRPGRSSCRCNLRASLLWSAMGWSRSVVHSAFRYFIAGIWLVNGLWCKVLGNVPRHEEIVGAILGQAIALPLTMAIGVAEIAMAVWIVSGWRYRICAAMQIIIILLMNMIEFFVVPHLLLWGRLNIIFALLLCALIYLNAFSPRNKAHA